MALSASAAAFEGLCAQLEDISPAGSLESESDDESTASAPLEDSGLITAMGQSLGSSLSTEREAGESPEASFASAAALKLLRLGHRGDAGLDASGSLLVRSSRGSRWTSAYVERAAATAARKARRTPRYETAAPGAADDALRAFLGRATQAVGEARVDGRRRLTAAAGAAGSPT